MTKEQIDRTVENGRRYAIHFWKRHPLRTPEERRKHIDIPDHVIERHRQELYRKYGITE